MSNSTTIVALAKSKAAANRAVKDVDAAVIEKAIANLSEAVKSLKTKEAQKEQKRRAAELKKLKAMMTKLGVSAEEAASLAGAKSSGRPKAKAAKKAKKPVAPKYEISQNGEKVLWTGRGRMPLVFKSYVEKGGNLENLLIK